VGIGGAFQLPDVALDAGANALTLTATDLAGNSSHISPPSRAKVEGVAADVS